MLKIISLKSGYGGAEVLKGVTFEVKPSSITTIIGQNGCGKSTILKSIFGLTDIYSGKIIYNNVNIRALPTYELIKHGISYVPQGRGVFSDMTVEENLEMGAYVFTNRTLIKKNILKIYEQFPALKEKRNKNASTLSGGQQQILSIARALMQKPKILLLDEPSLGLSPKITLEIFDIIFKIHNHGVSILLVEQNIKPAIAIADQILFLDQGIIAFMGDRKQFTSQKLNQLYLGVE